MIGTITLDLWGSIVPKLSQVFVQENNRHECWLVCARIYGNQQTLPLQIQAMQRYCEARQWSVVLQVEEARSAKSKRLKREQLLKAARQRHIDVILVWRLDRWGRSVTDLLNTLQELTTLNVGFISLMEALDLTTAMAALLAIFAEFERDILRERVKAGIAHARQQGKPHGRPLSAGLNIKKVTQLFQQGLSKSAIARQLSMSRTSVRRLLQQQA